MPAPPADLALALRKGAAHRHLFFRMEHPQGRLLAWDGVGDFVFGGETYSGVAGLATIEGVSDSGDIQNHEVVVTLNGVSLPQLVTVDPNVRGLAATITAAWLEESGRVVADRRVFSGMGDVMRTKLDANMKSIAIKLRAPLAEWRTPPRAYYTDADQQRRYPGDTGFKLVKTLEAATVSGWSINVESAGGTPSYSELARILDSATSDAIGDHTNGLSPKISGSSAPFTLVANDGSPSYVEETTTAPATFADQNYPTFLQLGGVNCYVDIAGDARSPGGKLVIASGQSSTRRLRRQGTIAADGAPTATTLSVGESETSTSRFFKTGSGWTSGGENQSGIVYCNRNGRSVSFLNSTAWSDTLATAYIEATTGAAVTVSGGLMQVGGANCVVSDTGVVLSAAGRRIVRQGGTSAEFLRTWT